MAHTASLPAFPPGLSFLAPPKHKTSPPAYELSTRILRFIHRHGTVDAIELAAGLPATTSDVQRHVRELTREGKIVSTDEDTFTLPERKDPADRPFFFP